MYADQPYWKLASYGVDFGLDQYEKVAELMKSCKSKVMLSINDLPDVREVLEGLNIDTVKIKYTMDNSEANRSQKKKLIITNY